MTPTSIADLCVVLQRLFTQGALAAGRDSQLCRRRRRLSADVFCQTLVFCWLAQPDVSLAGLARGGASRDCLMSPQAWHRRFTPAAADCLQRLLEQAFTVRVFGSTTPAALLARFPAVQLVDSTTVNLPAVFAALLPGCGGGHAATDGAAGLKVSVAYDLVRGELCGLRLASARTHDRACVPASPLLPGSLTVCDRGYFSLAAYGAMSGSGGYVLTRPLTGLAVWWEERRWTLPQLARRLRREARRGPCEREVLLGAVACWPARLILEKAPRQVTVQRRAALRAAARKKGQPVSAEALALAPYTLLVTNTPAALLSVEEALVLYGARWQIELLFKLWKQHGGLDESRSAKPHRILCELYGKLLAQLVGHWCLLAARLWERDDRSLVQAFQQVRAFASALLAALPSLRRLGELLTDLARSLRAGCALDTRRRRPSTCARLRQVAAVGLS